eukprot:7600482-Alexandrium_andersonii.AAC.1
MGRPTLPSAGLWRPGGGCCRTGSGELRGSSAWTWPRTSWPRSDRACPRQRAGPTRPPQAAESPTPRTPRSWASAGDWP